MIEEIRRAGPISTARFMALALGHPTLGYYAGRDPLGAAGDFITAPEVSQAFGELLGLWLGQAWSDLGKPDACRLVELGPGRGTLMADLLRAAGHVQGFRASLRVHLVETSERLRDLQRARLQGASVRWHEALDEVPPGPMLLVANEFFDALPIHQLVATDRGWVERTIDLAEGGLAFGLADRPSALARSLPEAGTGLGRIAEVSPIRARIARLIGRRLAAYGGVALIIDYGAWAPQVTGDTLQAVRAHRMVGPLEMPGESDLTAHVDFAALARAARTAGAAAHGPVPQGLFLNRLGIAARAAILLRQATPQQRRDIAAACERLIGGAQMGTLFQVLAITAPGAPTPPGFDPPPATRLTPATTRC